MDSNLNKKLHELEQLQAATKRLMADIEVERMRELAALPAAYGYHKLDDFIAALRMAGKWCPRVKNSDQPRVVQKRKITLEMREQIKAALLAKLPIAHIAKQFNISTASVGLVKMELGDQVTWVKKITPKLSEQVKTLVQAGHTAKQIQQQLGIGLSTIDKIKSKSGLTQRRIRPALAITPPAVVEPPAAEPPAPQES